MNFFSEEKSPLCRGNLAINPPTIQTFTYANTERCHLTSTQRYFRIQTIKWWNQLPNNLYINNYQEFTSTLHHHLLIDFKTVCM